MQPQEDTAPRPAAALPQPTAAGEDSPGSRAGPASVDGSHQGSFGSQVSPRTVLVVLLTTFLFGSALYLLWQLQDILAWLVVSVFLAVALNPLVNRLNRFVPRTAAILIAYALVGLIFVAVVALLVPPLVSQGQALVAQLTTLASAPGGLDRAIEDLANRNGVGSYVQSLRAQAQGLFSQLTPALGTLLALTTGLVGGVTALLSVLLIAFFLLADGERLVQAALRLFPADQRPHLRGLLTDCAGAVHGYVNGNLAISVIAGLASFVALTALGMPYAIALSLVIAIFDVIPLVGSTIGAGIVVLVAFFVDPFSAVVLVVFFLAYQQVENNLLQPLVYGRSVKLHPLVVFLAVLVGGQLLGILGALLAIPFAEMIRIVGSDWLANGGLGGTPPRRSDDGSTDAAGADAAGAPQAATERPNT